MESQSLSWNHVVEKGSLIWICYFYLNVCYFKQINLTRVQWQSTREDERKGRHNQSYLWLNYVNVFYCRKQNRKQHLK